MEDPLPPRGADLSAALRSDAGRLYALDGPAPRCIARRALAWRGGAVDVLYAEHWLKGPVPDDPQYFETHIYPDGHVEVAITGDISAPRLKLPVENHWRPGAERWPQCTPEQMQ